MSALADKITREHEFRWVGDAMGRGCTCGESFDFVPVDCTASAAYARHIATVTEAAVREQVSRDIGCRRDEAGGQPTSATGIALRAYIDGAFNEAARIARGGVA